jgi:hypothetical protein
VTGGGDGILDQRRHLPDGGNTLYAATYGRSVWTTSLAAS